MRDHKSYRSYLIESLKDPEEAAAYLEEVFEDGDRKLIALALKDVAEAQKNRQTENASDKHHADWKNCYQLLANQKMPELPMLVDLIKDIGLKLSVTHKEKQAA